MNAAMSAAANDISRQALATENQILKERVALQNAAGRVLLTLCAAQAFAIALLLVLLMMKN